MKSRSQVKGAPAPALNSGSPRAASSSSKFQFDSNPLWCRAIVPGFIAIVAFLVYYPSLESRWTDTDDIQLIVEDARFLTTGSAIPDAFERPFFPAGGIGKRYYRPLITASFMADSGHEGTPLPGPFHMTNALLHALSSVLVFFLARCLVSRLELAGTAALLFAVHPAAVQSVAWVPGRSDGLMAVFALASVLAWVNFDRSSSRSALGSHLSLLAAALLSKETAIAVVPVAVSYSLLVTRRYERVRSRLVWLGWLVTVSAWLALRTSQLGGLGSETGVATVLRNVPTLLVGIGKLLVPVDLAVLATMRDSAWWPGCVALLMLTSAAMWMRDERRRFFIWAAIILPLLLLAPTLAVADFLILDNRLYLPLVGIALAVAVFAEQVLVFFANSKKMLYPCLVIAIVALAMRSVQYARAFESPRSFCEAAVAGSPHLALAHVNLGSTEFRDGHFEAAEQQFRHAIAIDPRWPVAHNDLGLLYLNRGQLTQAESEFTIELSNNPDYPKAHFNLGLVLIRTGREEAARFHFERVVQFVPSDTAAWGELLKYWSTRDPSRANEIMAKMQKLGVRFFSPNES